MDTSSARRIIAPLLATVLALGIASAQQAAAPAQPQTAQAATPLSQQALEQLLAPIALHPDAVLAQILMAATYPLEIVQAARWVSANPGVTGTALEDAMAIQPWDPSVKALTALPELLQQMNEQLEWTQKLGDAFLAQQQDVMATVQVLRAKAAAAGGLKSTPQQSVTTQTVENKTVYVIQPLQPEVVYVPTYDPVVVYGTWPYPAYPPYAVYPPAYVYPPGMVFASGVFVGAAIWGDCDWGRSEVDVDINRYNEFNRSNISERNWSHNVEHRRGVAYGDQNVARRYNRDTGNPAARSREAYRGREQPALSNRGVDQGFTGERPRSGAGTSDRSTRGAAASRMEGGFAGMDSGSATRAASARGNASFGGARRGGGRRR